jgi:hypothetical protein
MRVCCSNDCPAFAAVRARRDRRHQVISVPLAQVKIPTPMTTNRECVRMARTHMVESYMEVFESVEYAEPAELHGPSFFKQLF